MAQTQILKPVFASALIAALISSCNTSIFDRKYSLRHQRLEDKLTVALNERNEVSARKQKAQGDALEKVNNRIDTLVDLVFGFHRDDKAPGVDESSILSESSYEEETHELSEDELQPSPIAEVWFSELDRFHKSLNDEELETLEKRITQKAIELVQHTRKQFEELLPARKEAALESLGGWEAITAQARISVRDIALGEMFIESKGQR